MIPKDKALKLIKIYMYVCSQYQETLNCYCQRYSNNSKPQFSDEDSLIVDSMPIMTCCGRNRQSKVAREIADKGYCSTKNQYYHGLKLHLVGYSRKGHLPFPFQIVLSSASENDLTVFKRECVPAIAGKTIFADKIYRDNPYWDNERELKCAGQLPDCLYIRLANLPSRSFS